MTDPLQFYKDLYTLLQEVVGKLRAHARSAMSAVLDDLGLELPRDTFALLTAVNTHPEPFSAERMMERLPWGAIEPWQTLLIALTERGFLQAAVSGYSVTPAGFEAVERFHNTFNQSVASLDGLPEPAMSQLLQSVRRICDACTQTGNFKWLGYNQKARSEGMPPLAQLDHYRYELGAFRDDVHLGLWQQTGCGGVAWDVFTWVWRGDVSTAAELYQELPFLGISEAKFGEALEEAAARGWLKADGTHYQVTAAGSHLRSTTEAMLDALFYAPWWVVPHAELEMMRESLTTLNENLAEAIQN